jgi:hypothetical protein
MFFSLLFMFVNLFCLYHFVCEFLQNFCNGFEISMKFCIFDTNIQYFPKNCSPLLALFANIQAKRGRNGSKKTKTYFINVS